MNKIGKWIFSVLLAAMFFALSACGDGEKPPITGGDDYTPITDFSDGLIDKVSQSTLYFNSSNAEWNAFLNDYFSRHVGYPTSNKVVNLDVGDGGTAWKEWETKSLMWHNSTQGLNSDRYQLVREWLNQTPVDRFGYVWSSRDDSGTSYSTSSYTSFDQGWPFPSMESMGGRGYGWGSNLNDAPNVSGWATRCTGFETNGQYSVQNGGYRLTPDDDSRDELRFTLTGIQKGYTYYAPFVETRFRILENESDVMGDLFLEWTTSDGATHSVSYAEAGTQIKDFNDGSFKSSVRLYFWMAPVEGWGSSDNVYGDTAPAVTSMSLVFKPAEGKQLSGIGFYIDYFRTDFDTRCAQNNAIFLDSIAEYYRYTGDDAYLAQMLETCRRAFQFYLTYCNGADGLIDQDNFVGHDGVPLAGHGISAGYFDIVSLPSVDFYFNVYYYKAVEAMLYLERMAKAAGIAQSTAAAVSAPDFSGEETYAQTEQSLAALLEKTRSAIQSTFWSEEKGRFVEGYNDWSGALKRYTSGTDEAETKIAELAARGEEFDLGFLAFNLEAVAAGVASDEQAKAILSWADGSRIIEGDDSTGKDLYIFDCAPRFNTVNNDYWYYCGVATDENYPFTQQVQNGGSCLWISYYDLMARFKTLGMDSFSERLGEIIAWYSDVSDAYASAVENGYTDKAKEFYRSYYYDLSKCSSNAYDVFNKTYNPRGLVLQGQVNGKDSAGGLGLDAEFLENAVVYTAIPDAILGLSSENYRTLNVSPSLPAGFEWFKLENLTFCYRKYDCCVGSDFVRISNVSKLQNRDDDVWITVRFLKPEKAFRVYVDGQITEYADEGTTVSVTVPFKSTFVKIG